MKAIKLAGLVLTFMATGAMASTVYYDVSGTQSGRTYNTSGTGTNMVPTQITWNLSLRATEDCRGIASYGTDIDIRRGGVKLTQAEAGFSLANWTGSFNVVGKGPNKTVVDAAASGGIGMLGASSKGTPVAAGGLGGFGAGYGGWDAVEYLFKDPDGEPDTGDEYWTWEGNCIWGLGLASRQTVLLNVGLTKYAVNSGTISAAAWRTVPGTYTVTVYAGATNVLKPDVDLNADVTGSFAVAADAKSGSSYTFYITPEPSTLLLLAGAGLLYRRRRA